jgi:acyl-CoA synthetase (AMP-forming)/AMP-acid ligase II
VELAAWVGFDLVAFTLLLYFSGGPSNPFSFFFIVHVAMAALTAQALRDGWYYTGDMGYMAAGQLYISGRKKDLIIVGGKNIYPQDLEAIANDIPGLYPGRTVAFGVSDERLGSEAVVMVCELTDMPDSADMKQIERQLRQRIVQEIDITLSDVRLVHKRWLIKTSSGKISRTLNRDKYLQEFRHL